MSTEPHAIQATFTVFAGTERIFSGSAGEAALAVRRLLAHPDGRAVLAFGDSDGRQLDFDLRGTDDEVIARYAPPRRSPGRPKLGVVGREVTLLPRHWEWLNAQPGGASVVLRKLVEAARRDTAGESALRAARDSAYAFSSAVAGNEVGYEDAMRALYAGDGQRFEALTAEWPVDVAGYARQLAAAALNAAESVAIDPSE